MFICTLCHVEEISAANMNRHLNSTPHKIHMRKIPGSFKEHKRMQKQVSDAMRGQRMYGPNQKHTNTNLTPLTPGTSGSSAVPPLQHNINNKTCAVYVRGFPLGTGAEPLRKYFSSYGQVQNVKMGKDGKHAIIKYTNKSDVNNILHNRHYLMDHRLIIKPVNNFSEQEVDEAGQLHSLVTSALEGISSFDEQVKVLMFTVQPDFSLLAPKYNQLCRDLHEILVTAFPMCNVHPFGSTVTGLSFKCSDVDIHVSGVGDCDSRRNKNNMFRTKHLLHTSNLFVNICAIVHAKVPIIRCRHKYLDLDVDINFVNMHGVYNSFLISYYLELDWKLKPLMILIKYWAKVYKLTGSPHLIKNYTLVLMLIFFLQQEPYCLPSVRLLQSDCRPYMHAGWNVGFSRNFNFNLLQLREASLLQLFKKFLAYYSNFNYDDDMICPYLGRTLPKDSFKDCAPQEFDLYINNVPNDGPIQFDKPVCIQDPFEHTRNVTLVTKYVLNDFVDVCHCTLENISNTNSEENLLYKLFKSEYYKLDKVPEFSARFTIAVNKNCKILNETASGTNPGFHTVKYVTETVLRNIFRFTLIENIPSDATKANVSEVKSFTFSCVGHYRLWEGRPKTKVFQKNPAQTILDKEQIISDGLAEKNPRSEQPLIEFQLIVEIKLDQVATFTLQNFRSYKKVFKTFSLFFVSKFPVWYHEYVNELNKTAVSSDRISLQCK